MDEVRFFGNDSDLPRLKALRAERGWSVRRLAQEADLSPATINQIELGKRRAQDGTVVKLTEALGVERVDLIFPPEQVRVWKEQDRSQNEVLEEQLAAMTDAEIRVFLLDSRRAGRRLREIVKREQSPEE